jgi:predicted HTH domain antitoxin
MNVINLRLEDELLAKLHRLAQLEHLDRTNLIRSLLRRSTEEVSLEQAAELADVSPWEIMSMMVERGINHGGTADGLRLDAKRRLEEMGYKKMASML